MIWVNGQYTYDVYLYRKVPEGQETIYKDNGGDLLMTKSVNNEYGSATSKLGATINMGNFESLRVDVGVTIPCNKGNEVTTIEEAYAIAEEKLVAHVTEIKKKFQ
jgi:hypothetical protein